MRYNVFVAVCSYNARIRDQTQMLICGAERRSIYRVLTFCFTLGSACKNITEPKPWEFSLKKTKSWNFMANALFDLFQSFVICSNRKLGPFSSNIGQNSNYTQLKYVSPIGSKVRARTLHSCSHNAGTRRRLQGHPFMAVPQWLLHVTWCVRLH